MNETWNGFKCENFEFEGYKAIIVFPENPVGKLALKVEYWGAFPDIEIGLLKNGFHLAYIKNISRFATKEECDIKARFVKHLAEKYSLSEKCVPVGMSCGGAHAVRFAGLHPELISCVYIDAPVLNYSSYPGKIGNESCERVWDNEFVKAYPGIKRCQLVNFSEHPLCQAENIIKNNIPVLMVYGTEDCTVIYDENGKLFEEAFEGTDLLTTIAVGCRGHHPHGMIGSNERIVNYILEHS